MQAKQRWYMVRFGESVPVVVALVAKSSLVLQIFDAAAAVKRASTEEASALAT